MERHKKSNSFLKQFDFFSFILDTELLTCIDKNPLLKFLQSLVSSNDTNAIYMTFQRVQFAISGYDADQRELYELPEFILFSKALSSQFPFFLYFLPKNLSMLVVMATLEGRCVSMGQCYIDPKKLDIFLKKCIKDAIDFGINAGHSEEEMHGFFM